MRKGYNAYRCCLRDILLPRRPPRRLPQFRHTVCSCDCAYCITLADRRSASVCYLLW